jgi:hypothetical protein
MFLFNSYRIPPKRKSGTIASPPFSTTHNNIPLNSITLFHNSRPPFNSYRPSIQTKSDTMSSPPTYVACIGIIGPDNNPLLIQKNCQEAQDLEIDTLLFCCLDYFEVQGGGHKSTKPPDRFLGNIQTSDRFQIWGYRASLGYKIIILTSHTATFSDGVVRRLCEDVKDILFDAILDPFYIPFSVIESEAVLASLNTASAGLRPASI